MNLVLQYVSDETFFLVSFSIFVKVSLINFFLLQSQRHMPNALTGSSAEAEAHRCFLVTTANTTPLRIGLINKTGNKFRTEELDKEIKCSPC